MADAILLRHLDYTTPTIWAAMRCCSLKGVFTATEETRRWILSDPRAWLGIAFHKLMAAARSGASMTMLEDVWQTAIHESVENASTHLLDRRFGKPERWPGYFLVRQRALSSAIAKATSAKAAPIASANRTTGSERRLQTKDGKLVGKPDNYDGNTITEFKSSLPDASRPQADQVLDEYRRQLRLYAAIIADIDGVWPKTGKILAASGDSLSFPIVPAECASEATQALASAENANRSLSKEAADKELASPSNDACARCPFQHLCPAFWSWLNAGNKLTSSRAAAQCQVTAIEVGPDGDIYNLQVSVSDASIETNSVQSIALRRSVHGDLTTSDLSSLRITGARIRADGKLQADIQTIVAPLSRLPKLLSSA